MLAATKFFHRTVSIPFIAVLGFGSQAWAQQGPPYAAQPYGAPSYGAQAAPQYGQPPAQQYGQPPAQYGQPPAQYGPQSAAAGQEAPQLLSPDQLQDLVAPIALYPDSLLSEILAASTYPLEIVDAEQWLQQNKNLPPAQRMDAAKQQSWDPSVQALAAFPDVLDILGRDIRWTTDLGNAFLAQQADVMNAIQNLRARAQQSGRLQSTPQQTVSTQVQDGQTAIQIAPTDPQMIYPPVYDPYAIWGAPVYGAYPTLWYPPAWGYGGYGSGIGFGVGYFIGGLFSGLLGFGGWGWGLSWFAHSLFFNPLFFAHFGFHGYGAGFGGYGLHGALVAGHPVWAHDPVHRMGVPYSNRAVASRFGGRVGGAGVSAASRGVAPSGAGRAEAARAGLGRSEAGGWRGVGSSGARAPTANQFATRTAPQASGRQSFAQGNRSTGTGNAGGYNRVGPSQNFATTPRSNQNMNRSESNRVQPQARQSQGMARSFSAPHAQSAPHASASPSHGGSSSHGSASHGGGGHSGGGHSGGGHSGGRK
ncbi:MAG TPA: DUF3300 domain-containing protein [Bryobacteraceae bacterium]|jgi:hypothetical protein